MKQIADYPNYYILEDGRVWNKKTKKWLKISLCNDYLRVRIFNKTPLIHRLVAEAFIPNPDNKPYVNHINGIKSDNRVENLEWVTHKENIRHAWENGLCKPTAKLTWDIVRSIRDKYTNGYTQKDLCKHYNVDQATISCIVNFKTWKE